MSLNRFKDSTPSLTMPTPTCGKTTPHLMAKSSVNPLLVFLSANLNYMSGVKKFFTKFLCFAVYGGYPHGISESLHWD